MEPMSRKIYCTLPPPTEEDARDDVTRIQDALGFPVRCDLSVLRKLYPLLPDANWNITVTLGYDGQLWHIIDAEPGDTTAHHYGVAADLGSTTVCMTLFDLHTGEVVCQESAYNRQIAYGEDILTRVFYEKDNMEKREQLRKATLESFREVLGKLEERSGVPVCQYSAMVVAGNTTMMHFFLGLDGFAVFASPYAPHAARFDFYRAEELGLPTAGFVYCVPCRANYLGGDILSGLVAVDLPEREEIGVFLDIGTNGELVVGCRDFLLAGAGAAGPALEGGVVRTGMRAVAGAVSAVTVENGKFQVETIENAPPRGICGSGIVDLLAALLCTGKIDRLGRFRTEAPGVITIDGEAGFCYASGLVFFQSDMDAFLRTKAAANTMVAYMLEYAGIPMDQVARFYAAGAFGTHLDAENSVTIGLYPDLPRERIVNAGNSSLEGAGRLLRDFTLTDRVAHYLDTMEYVQFGAVPDFLSRMTAASALPHTDLSLYPSVAGKIPLSYLP